MSGVAPGRSLGGEGMRGEWLQAWAWGWSGEGRVGLPDDGEASRTWTGVIVG